MLAALRRRPAALPLALLLSPVIAALAIVGRVWELTYGAADRLPDSPSRDGEGWALLLDLAGVEPHDQTPVAIDPERQAEKTAALAVEQQPATIDAPTLLVAAQPQCPALPVAEEPVLSSKPTPVTVSNPSGLYTETVRRSGKYAGKVDRRPCKRPVAGRSYLRRCPDGWEQVVYLPAAQEAAA